MDKKKYFIKVEEN